MHRRHSVNILLVLSDFYAYFKNGKKTKPNYKQWLVGNEGTYANFHLSFI